MLVFDVGGLVSGCGDGVGDQKTPCGKAFFPSTVYILGIKLGSLDLAAILFPQ